MPEESSEGWTRDHASLKGLAVTGVEEIVVQFEQLGNATIPHSGALEIDHF